MPRRDPFAELVDRARTEGAAQARSRERWLRQQAEEEAELVGTMVDLAERGEPVMVRTTSGRRHQGTLVAVAVDFVVVRALGGADTWIPLDAIAFVRPQRGRGASAAAGDRPPPLDVRLAELLAELAGDRPRVRLVSRGDGEAVAGELRSVGVDVVTVALDGEPGGLCYVALQSLTEVGVLTSG
jgi:hypothetical protein